MARRRRAARWLAGLAAAFLAPMLVPGTASACLIDNTASLSANGVRASLTLTTATYLGRWAPFTVDRAFAGNAPVQLSESRGDLARSLPAATVAASYRWSLGDGATVLGHVVTHRYTRPGVYKVTVYGLYGRASGPPIWAAFDSVLLRIVPPSQIGRANQDYRARRAFGAAATTYLWVLEGALVVVALGVGLAFLLSRRPARADGAADQSQGRPAASGRAYDPDAGRA